MKTTRTAARAAALLASLLALQPLAAHALSDAEHKRMLKSSPAYAQADAELTQAWKALRAALKRAGLDHHFEGKPDLSQPGLLQYQRDWLNQGRDEEAGELRGDGSVADGYAAAVRKRTAWLRERAEALNAFAALPAPSHDAAFSRLLKARGGTLHFAECAGNGAEENAAPGSANSGPPDPAALCGEKLDDDFPRYAEFGADGALYIGVTGRPDTLPSRWKLAADGTIHAVSWDASWSYRLRDDRYLQEDDDWFMLKEE